MREVVYAQEVGKFNYLFKIGMILAQWSNTYSTGFGFTEDPDAISNVVAVWKPKKLNNEK